MELNETQFSDATPKKWLTDEDYYKRFNEERDAKQDYTDEDKKVYEQHIAQWKLLLPLRSLAKAHRKGDKTAVDKGIELFKDYNPTKKQMLDILKNTPGTDGDELIQRLDTHFGAK